MLINKLILESICIFYRHLGIDPTPLVPRINSLIDVLKGEIEDYLKNPDDKFFDNLRMICDVRLHRASMGSLHRDKNTIVALVASTCKTFSELSHLNPIDLDLADDLKLSDSVEK